ncbi:hypothetical protein AYK25_02375 [Thermoplasmatales archaeon SM1-50]|nr:MAG: hypothetical protein AYK25_02375 [Thermoplasmatales archaeon SM1-50]
MSVDYEYTLSRTKERLIVNIVNSLLKMGQKLDLGIYKLDRETILNNAIKITGYKNFGNEKYIEVLDRLVDNINKVDITPLSKYFLNFIARKTTMNRLYIENYIEKHPEIEDIPIESPVFIVGFPRTGTTLLQNVLSSGDGYRSLYLWELATPYPLHNDKKKDKKMRIAKIDMVLKMLKRAVPEMTSVHDVGVNTKEECWILLANSLYIPHTDIGSGLIEWNDWLIKMDRTWVYKEYKRLLQIQAHNMPTEKFVLKCPSHLFNLKPIMKIFPDACIVWTHRNPINSIASTSSLMSLARKFFFGYVNQKQVGEMVKNCFYSIVMEAMKLRGKTNNNQFYDINFEILQKNISQSVKNIRNYFELPHNGTHDKAVQDFLNMPRKDKPGKHRYTPEQFGLDKDEVINKFGKYIDKFNIKV